MKGHSNSAKDEISTHVTYYLVEQYKVMIKINIKYRHDTLDDLESYNNFIDYKI